MQATLESLDGLARRLNVSLPLTEIDTEVQTRLRKIARTAKISGFRPGKVPLKIVEQQFGPQVRQEVLGDVVKRSFGEAVREQNLKVAGFPNIEPKPDGTDAAFEYSATFEVYPEVNVGTIAGVKLNRPVHEVTDADVDETINILLKQRVKYDTVERPVTDGDEVVIDYRGTIDGVEFPGGVATDFVVVLGQGRLLPAFETNLHGISPGDQTTFELAFPEDYHGAEVAGKSARFEVTVKRVATPRLPDVDPQFAREMGVDDGDVAKLRTEVRSNVEREVRKRIQGRLKEQVMQALLDAVPIDVPKSLVDLEAQHLARAAIQDLAARGMDVKQIPVPQNRFEAQAKRRVSLGLILAELVKIHGLQPRPEQIRKAIEEHAQTFERPNEVLKWYYQVPERLNEFESVVLEDNVVEWVIGGAQLQEQPIAFDQLMSKS